MFNRLHIRFNNLFDIAKIDLSVCQPPTYIHRRIHIIR